MSRTDLKTELDELALQIAKAAKSESDGKQQVDAFKAVAAYYLGETKLSSKIAGDEEGDTMNGFKSRLSEAGKTAGTA